MADHYGTLRQTRRMVTAALELNGFDSAKVDPYPITRKLLDISGNTGESITDSLTFEFLCEQVAAQFADPDNDGSSIIGCHCKSCEYAREIVREGLAKSTRGKACDCGIGHVCAAHMRQDRESARE